MRALAPLGLGFVLALAAGCDAGDALPRGATGGADDVARRLHRGELSAVASYREAIRRNATPAWTATLERILREHETAADRLAARVVALKGSPVASAGAWDGLTEVDSKGSTAVGDEAARDALRLGEQRGQSAYDEALRSGSLDEETRSLVRGRLLPLAHEHVRTLEALRKAP